MLRRVPFTFILFLCAILGSALPLAAQELDLSADQPIAYDAGQRMLVAEGNARFAHEQAIVEADEIRYDQRAKTVSATGNVRVTREGVRLVTEHLTYDLDTREFVSGAYRAGYPPIFVKGESFSGTLDRIEISESTVHFREPDGITPHLAAGSATVVPDERLAAEDVRLVLPLLGGVPLPDVNRIFGAAPPLELSGAVGVSSHLGAYARTRLLVPLSTNLGVGANLDGYTSRGVLIGPALRYHLETPDRYLDVNLSTGWIYDAGSRGQDLLGRSIDPARYFGALSFRSEANGLEITGRTEFLSDSEMTRDFRPDRYSRTPEPDSFLEITQLRDDRFLSVFLRRSPNDFYGITERLPELRIEQPARPIGPTGLYHSWNASFLQYRVARVTGLPDPDYPALLFSETDDSLLGALFNETPGFPEFGDTAINNRSDLNYGLQYPLALSRWAQFVPRAGFRYTYWDPEESSSASRLAGELGFDLRLHAFAEWDVSNRTWKIDGLRHILRPVLQYRWQPISRDGDLADEARYDRRLYSPLMPAMDLADRRDVDMIGERQILRFGLENRLLTRETANGTRTLLEFDLYQDLVPSVPEGADDWHGTYLQIRSMPARWLELGISQKYHTEEASLEETRLRATVRSARKWEVDFALDFLDGVYDQYRLEGFYQLLPRIAVFGGLRYDAEREALTRQVYGVRQRLGRSWELEYAVVLREGSEREGDFSLQLGLRLAEF